MSESEPFVPLSPAVEEWILADSPYRPGGYGLAMVGPSSPWRHDPCPVTDAEARAYGEAHGVNRTQARQAVRRAKWAALVARGRAIAQREGMREGTLVALALIAECAPAEARR